MSRIRNTDYNTVHHLTSRIAHRAYFLKEEARNDFLSLTMRVSAFSGVELLGWCIMDNHFHLYVYLPEPPTLSDEEVIRRYHLLKGYVRRLLSDEDDDRIVKSLRPNWRGVSDTPRQFRRLRQGKGRADQVDTSQDVFDRRVHADDQKVVLG